MLNAVEYVEHSSMNIEMCSGICHGFRTPYFGVEYRYLMQDDKFSYIIKRSIITPNNLFLVNNAFVAMELTQNMVIQEIVTCSVLVIEDRFAVV